VWVDRNGKEEPLGAPLNAYLYPRISPDGTQVALAVGPVEGTDIWIWSFARNVMSRLTLDSANNASPLWTPDGKRIVFSSTRDRSYRVYWKAADGSGEDQPLSSVIDGAIFPWAWSKDGKTMVLGEFMNKTQSLDIGALSMEGDHKWSPLLKERYGECQPRISPDGSWIAYVSNESGEGEIYVRPFPEVNKGRRQVSAGGGGNPLWSPDGRELFYRCGDAVMAVSVKTGTAFGIDIPKTLFNGTYVAAGGVVNVWDISPDGKRFLMIKPPGAATSAKGGPRKINIVLNWLEELRQRVPVK